jgi:hypothetical protein
MRQIRKSNREHSSARDVGYSVSMGYQMAINLVGLDTPELKQMSLRSREINATN